MKKTHRFYVRSPNGQSIFGFDLKEPAEAAALEYGEGAQIVDTMAQAYITMVQEVRDGKLLILPYGGWDTGKFGVDRDLIEGIKKGHAAIVHAFLEKGASPNSRDPRGGSALHWAAANGRTEIVRLLLAHGAEINIEDADGETPLDVARQKGAQDTIAVLERAGGKPGSGRKAAS